MNKTSKIILGCIFIGAAIGLYIYNSQDKKEDTNKTTTCPSGQVPCANGRCYDPNLHYKGDPCLAAASIYVPLEEVKLDKDEINKSEMSSM